MNLPLFIGLRYTFSRHEQKFISFVSLISLLGTVLGVSTMVLVLSIMNGFDRDLKQRLLAMIPHAFVEIDVENQDWQRLASSLKQQPGVVAVAPWIEGKGLLSFEGTSLPVQVNGISPKDEAEVSLIATKMLEGRLADLDEVSSGIILGQLLASQLGVNVGDKITLLLPDIIVSPVGVFPRKKQLQLIGVFRTATDLDKYSALITLPLAEKLFLRNGSGVNRLRIKTEDIQLVDKTVLALKKNWLPRVSSDNPTSSNLVIKTWADTHQSLFAAIQMEKKMIAVLLFSVIAVAVFNIVSILIMMVSDKTKEIAILRVMGASQKTILCIFIVQGLVVSCMGIIGGILLGSLLAFYGADIIHFIEGFTLSRELSYFSRLPSDWRLSDALLIGSVALLMSLLATLYPANQSAKIDPIKGLNS